MQRKNFNFRSRTFSAILYSECLSFLSPSPIFLVFSYYSQIFPKIAGNFARKNSLAVKDQSTYEHKTSEKAHMFQGNFVEHEIVYEEDVLF